MTFVNVFDAIPTGQVPKNWKFGNGNDDIASKLNDVVQAVPTIAHYPDLAMAAVKGGGDHVANAQGIMGAHVISTAAHALTGWATRQAAQPQDRYIGTTGIANMSDADYVKWLQTQFTGGIHNVIENAVQTGQLDQSHIDAANAEAQKGVSPKAIKNVQDLSRALDVAGNLGQRWYGNVGLDQFSPVAKVIGGVVAGIGSGKAQNELAGGLAKQGKHEIALNIQSIFHPTKTNGNLITESNDALTHNPLRLPAVFAHNAIKMFTSQGDSLQRMWQTLEYEYKTKGAYAAGQMAAPIVLASAAAAATGGLAEGAVAPAAEIAVDVALNTVPKVAAAAAEDAATATASEAATTTVANAGSEAGISAAHNAVMKYLMAAKNTVADQLGLKDATTLRTADVTAEEIASQMQAEFSRLTENAGIDISKNLKTAIENHLDEVAADIKTGQQMLNPFSATTKIGEATGFNKIPKGLGLIAHQIGRAMDSRSLLAAGIGGPAYLKTYHSDAWEASKKENTIGQSLSETVGLGKNSVLASATDFSVSLMEPMFMAGRSIGIARGALGSAGNLAVNVEKLDQAFKFSPRYRNAVRSMANMAKTEDAQGLIQRNFTNIPPQMAKDIANLGKGANGYNVHQVIRSYTEAADYVGDFHVPRLGLYGMVKQARTSDNALLNYFAKTFVQLPTVVSEKGIQSQTNFLMTDKNAINAVSRMLVATGMENKTVTKIIAHLNELVASGEFSQIENVYKRAMKDSLYAQWDRVFMEGMITTGKGMEGPMQWISKIEEAKKTLKESFTEEGVVLDDATRASYEKTIADLEATIAPHQQLYNKLRSEINDFVNTKVGRIGPDEAQIFHTNAKGETVSSIIPDQHKGAALLFNERGDVHFVNYREFNNELRKLISQYNGKILTTARDGKRILIPKAVGSAVEFRQARLKALRESRRVVTQLAGKERAGSISEKQQASLDAARTRIKTEKETPGFAPTKAYTNATASSFFQFSDTANKFINDTLFKPMALLTPGWALRVSASELGLNTVRLGPVTIVAGFTAANLRRQISQAVQTADKKAGLLGVKAGQSDIESELWKIMDAEHQGGEVPQVARKMMTTEGVQTTLRDYGGSWEISKAVARNIALFVRGSIASVEQSLLTAIGHEEYVKAATYLAYQHDHWLPNVVDSKHTYPTSDIDIHDKYASINDAGGVKMKRARFADAYTKIGFEQSGYYEAWKWGALKYSSDEMLGQPVALAYLNLVNQGLEGQALHQAAVAEARKILNNIPEHELETMARSKNIGINRTGVAQSEEPLTSWAEDVVGGLEGKVRGRGVDGTGLDGVIHKNLLEDIANQRVPQGTYGFMDRYAFDPETGKRWKPVDVAESHIGRVPQNLGTSDLIQRASTWGHEKVLGPIVNHMTRQPVYIAEFVQHRQALKETVDRGILTPDQADLRAQVEAAQNMVRFIHNPMDKMKFEDNMRVIAPFYFAQNQAWRRAGRMFAENPGAFMQYAATMLGATSWVSQTVNKMGISLFNIPASAFLFGIPYTGSLSSIQTMDPFAEGSAATDPNSTPKSLLQMIFGYVVPKFGPIISIPAHVLLENIGLTQKVISKKWDDRAQGLLLGDVGRNAPLWNSFVPNSIARAALQGGTFMVGLDKHGFNTAPIQAQLEAAKSVLTEKSHTRWVQDLAKIGKKGYIYQDALIDINQYQADLVNSKTRAHSEMLAESHNRAMWLWLGKIGVGSWSPVSIGVGKFDTAGRELYKKYQKLNTPANPFLGDQKFYHDHPDMVAETLGSTSSVFGSYLPENKTFNQMVSNDKNRALIEKYPLAAYGLTGGINAKDATYSQPAMNAQIQLGLRQRMMPEDFVKKMAVTIGNHWYYDLLQPWYQSNKGQAGVYDQMVKYRDSYGRMHNPDWINNFNASTSQTDRWASWEQFKQMMNDPQLKNDKQYTKVFKLVNDVVIPQYVNPLLSAITDAQHGKNGATFAGIKIEWQRCMNEILNNDGINGKPDWTLLRPLVTGLLANLG